MIKTETGRVVYRRPRHFFSGRDLYRIARAMPPPLNFQEGLVRLLTIGEIYRDIAVAVFQVVVGEEAAEAVGSVKRVLRSIILAALQNISMDPGEYERMIQILDML